MNRSVSFTMAGPSSLRHAALAFSAAISSRASAWIPNLHRSHLHEYSVVCEDCLYLAELVPVGTGESQRSLHGIGTVEARKGGGDVWKHAKVAGFFSSTRHDDCRGIQTRPWPIAREKEQTTARKTRGAPTS